PVASHQPDEDLDVDRLFHEPHMPVREQNVGPAWMEAVDFPVVRAINGARTVEGGSVRRGATAPQQVSGSPGAARKRLVWAVLESVPQLLRPARAFGDQDRVDAAILDRRQRRRAVNCKDSLVIA